jgi:hypothetical protein
MIPLESLCRSVRRLACLALRASDSASRHSRTYAGSESECRHEALCDAMSPLACVASARPMLPTGDAAFLNAATFARAADSAVLSVRQSGESGV